jgi:hypothetical protein
MGCNFTQLSDPIGSDCQIRSDSNTIDSLVISQPGCYEFHRISTELPSVSYRIQSDSTVEFNHLNLFHCDLYKNQFSLHIQSQTIEYLISLCFYDRWRRFVIRKNETFGSSFKWNDDLILLIRTRSFFR